MIRAVKINRGAKRDLLRVPTFIADKLMAWVKRVEKVGLEEVRKVKG